MAEPSPLAQRTIEGIYTDGACSGNPGPGGWGVVIYFSDGSVQELGGPAAATTNNRMEMQAAIAALEYIGNHAPSARVPLYTDSEYVKNGITKWVMGWKQKGWKTAQGKPVLNQDLWQQLDHLNSRQIEWRYVRGHAGNVGNERCDAIARAFSLGQTPVLQSPPTDPTTAAPVPELSQAPPSLTHSPDISSSDATMTDLNLSLPPDTPDNLPREVRVTQLRHQIETLRIADEVARQGYLITSAELADLMDVNASAVTSRGDHWVWRNWVVSRVRREGNQILWQLERVD